MACRVGGRRPRCVFPLRCPEPLGSNCSRSARAIAALDQAPQLEEGMLEIVVSVLKSDCR